MFANWARILERLRLAGLCLSAKKTIIAPRSARVLGWIWRDGQLTASPHRISTLSTCSKPESVKALRGFLGAAKVLSRVVPNLSARLGVLENMAAGMDSKAPLTWSDIQLDSFASVQKHLLNNKSIHILISDDQLWLVTDASKKLPGLGATLYAQRDGRLLLAGFFSAKLKKPYLTWLPCEVEASSIAASIQHFAPFISE